MSAMCSLLVGAFAFCACRFCQTKRREIVKTPAAAPPGSISSLHISQSTPDLATTSSGNGTLTLGDEPIGRSHYKTVIKQVTLPALPQQHLAFRRQLCVPSPNVAFTIQRMRYNENSSTAVGVIEPDLYRHSDRDGIGVATVPEKRQDMRLATVHAADFSGTSDPYVKIYLLPDRKHKHQTKVHRKTLNPEFNETFTFNVGYVDLEERTLQFSIYDFDRFSRHDIIGVVLLRNLTRVIDLTQEQAYSMDICCVPQDKLDYGELLLSLCYLPTAGRLTVTVIKARNLKVMDISGTSDPYVKVSLMCHGRRIKKKKTQVKKSTLNPVYNEAIVFDVPRDSIEDVSLLVNVIDYDSFYQQTWHCARPNLALCPPKPGTVSALMHLETALLRVKNDIAETLDRKYTTILVMLDLSCAFDTVDHELLMTRLENSFGISDKALAWLQSYISERYQKAAVGSAESVDSILTCGVPQGSVFGPYIEILSIDTICSSYAEDIQIYLTVEPVESIVAALKKVELCVAEVAAWLIKNL
ncbi:Synaptotagmin-9 [Lamellibrachia satsuma]|nr:Synaptotagmin-9 [Lamellibrachia satsuma]